MNQSRQMFTRIWLISASELRRFGNRLRRGQLDERWPKKLAEESAYRAAAIVRGDAQPGAGSVQTEPSAAPTPEPAPESYPSDKPTPT